MSAVLIRLPLMVLVCGVFAYNQLNNSRYTFQNVASDYKSLVSQYWLIREQKQTDQLSFNPHLFENVQERTSRLVTEKVKYKDSVVRNFSVKHSLDNFDNYHYKYQDTRDRITHRF